MRINRDTAYRAYAVGAHAEHEIMQNLVSRRFPSFLDFGGGTKQDLAFCQGEGV